MKFVPLPLPVMIELTKPTSIAVYHKTFVSVRPPKFQDKEGPDRAEK